MTFYASSHNLFTCHLNIDSMSIILFTQHKNQISFALLIDCRDSFSNGGRLFALCLKVTLFVFLYLGMVQQWFLSIFAFRMDGTD